MQEVSSKKEKAVTKLMTNLASGFESMVDAQEQLGSVASSSQRQSQQALDLIRRSRLHGRRTGSPSRQKLMLCVRP